MVEPDGVPSTVTAVPVPVPAEVSIALSREQRFVELVQRHRERAVRIAWRLTGEDRATAEEVAQDAFLRAYSGLGRFRDEAELDTWFYRILVRQAANRRRWRGLRQRWGDLWGSGETGAAVEQVSGRPDSPVDPALRACITEAMDALSPGQRTIFTLVHLEGFTVAEAATMASIAPGTAKSHLHRASKSLRAALEPQREEIAP
jgi:RNA polymerase sigma-70 factor (ECF subfamily)